MSETVRLTIRSGEARGATATVDDGRIVIGRADDCDLTVPDDVKVSRRHAAVERLADGRVALVDLGSINGTFLNGRRVEEAEVDGQAQIQVGDTVLVSTSGERPHDATVFGELGSKTYSAIHRIVVQRSARRAVIASGLAVVAVAVLAVLIATGVLASGESSAENVQRVVKEAESSTVVIQSAGEGGAAGSGTGWVLDGREGLVVTNAHVATVPGPLQVGIGGELHRASRVGHRALRGPRRPESGGRAWPQLTAPRPPGAISPSARRSSRWAIRGTRRSRPASPPPPASSPSRAPPTGSGASTSPATRM